MLLKMNLINRPFLLLLIILIFIFIIFISLFLQNKELKDSKINYNPDMNPFDREMYTLLTELLNRQKIPGLQVSVKTMDKVHNYSIGTIDNNREKKIFNEDLLRIGSVSKLFTAVLILKDVEQHFITLDDPISTWFPEIPNAEQIKIKNLLNHTSGIYDYTTYFPFQLQTVTKNNRVWKPEKLYSFIPKGKPYFLPGEQHLYSNSNYLLLGLISEKVHKKPFKEIFQDELIKEAGLTNTFFVQDSEDIPKGLISGYDRDIIPFGLHEIAPTNTSWLSGAYTAGGIVSNSEDLLKFLDQIFLYQILRKESVEMMTDFNHFTDPDIPDQIGYGLGVRILKINGDVLIGHTGTTPGFGAAAFYCPEKNYSITLIGNVSLINQGTILERIIQQIHQ